MADFGDLHCNVIEVMELSGGQFQLNGEVDGLTQEKVFLVLGGSVNILVI